MANGWQSCGSSLLACISVNFRGFYNHLPMVTAGYSPHCSLWASTCVVHGCLFVFPPLNFKRQRAADGAGLWGAAGTVSCSLGSPGGEPRGCVPTGAAEPGPAVLQQEQEAQQCAAWSCRRGCGSAGCLQHLLCCSLPDQTGEME